MSLSFSVELLNAIQEGTEISYVLEEDTNKENDSKKSKDDKFKAYLNHSAAAFLLPSASFAGLSQLPALPPGFFNKPFNPPDVI